MTPDQIVALSLLWWSGLLVCWELGRRFGRRHGRVDGIEAGLKLGRARAYYEMESARLGIPVAELIDLDGRARRAARR